VYLAKMNNLPKHHGAGPNAAASVASAQGQPWLFGLFHKVGHEKLSLEGITKSIAVKKLNR